MIAYPYRERTLGRLAADKAARNGDKPFLVFEQRVISYRELHEQSNRIADSLRRNGVAAGQHVALLIDNKPEIILSYFALGKLGAVAVPLNTAAKGEMLAYYLTQSDSSVAIVDAEHLGRIHEVLPRVPALRDIYVIDGPGDSLRFTAEIALRPFAQLLEGDPADLDIPVTASQLCLLMYSSGTTGPSKGSMASHCCALTHGFVIAEAFGYRPDDRLYVCLPLFHGNAWYCSCLPAFVADASVALARRFSASRFWADINETGATQFNALGAMVNFLWARAPDDRERSHRVRQALVIPRPTGSYDAFEARFRTRMQSLYGLTDAGIIAVTSLDDPVAKRNSAGRVCRDVEVRIVDDDDIALPAGAVGEIVLRGAEPWMFPTGYYKMPEATVAAWRNLWFHTGDLGWMDEDGFLYFAGRKKDAIRRRGENISCFEVEQIVLAMPGIADAAAFPVSSEYSEDEVMLAVVISDPTTGPVEIIAYCRENMPYFMVPRYVELVTVLPRTPSEKVEKYKLRASAEARLDTIWDREKAGITVRR